jgi:hypothetical protein
MRELTAEEKKTIRRWYALGKYTMMVVTAAIPASLGVAIWSGEWRWLLITAPCAWFVRSVLRHG